MDCLLLNEHDVQISFAEDFMSIILNDEKNNQIMDCLVLNCTDSHFINHLQIDTIIAIQASNNTKKN